MARVIASLSTWNPEAGFLFLSEYHCSSCILVYDAWCSAPQYEWGHTLAEIVWHCYGWKYVAIINNDTMFSQSCFEPHIILTCVVGICRWRSFQLLSISGSCCCQLATFELGKDMACACCHLWQHFVRSSCIRCVSPLSQETYHSQRACSRFHDLWCRGYSSRRADKHRLETIWLFICKFNYPSTEGFSRG
jgi:hypothetical protein